MRVRWTGRRGGRDLDVDENVTPRPAAPRIEGFDPTRISGFTDRNQIARLAQALSAFTWRETPQGSSYWADVQSKMEENLRYFDQEQERRAANTAAANIRETAGVPYSVTVHSLTAFPGAVRVFRNNRTNIVYNTERAFIDAGGTAEQFQVVYRRPARTPTPNTFNLTGLEEALVVRDEEDETLAEEAAEAVPPDDPRIPFDVRMTRGIVDEQVLAPRAIPVNAETDRLHQAINQAINRITANATGARPIRRARPAEPT